MKNNFKVLAFICLPILLSISLKAQISVTTGIAPVQLVQDVLLGTGVTATNIIYTGSPNAIGRFQTGPTPTNLGLSSGVVMSTGNLNATIGVGSPGSSFASTNNAVPGSALLNSIVAPLTTNDASVLEFNFTPQSDTIKFRYVFASEEYPEFVCSGFNDVFGFFISGPNPAGGSFLNHNIARVPGTTLPVAINTINAGVPGGSYPASGCTSLAYSSLYVNNSSGVSIVYDGFTVVLTAWALVVPCVTYHIRLAIADVGDSAYDSAVFLEANSFQTNAFEVGVLYDIPGGASLAVEGCSEALVFVSLQNPVSYNFTLNFSLGGTSTPGTDFPMFPPSLVIPAGQLSANLVITPFFDGLVEGDESVWIIFTDACGNTDTVDVTIKDYAYPIVTATGGTSFCESSALQVPLGATTANGYAPFIYTWNHGIGVGQNPIVLPTTTTTYVVTSKDVCGNSSSDSVTVNVFPDPIVTVTATPQAVCPGFSTSLLATGADTYLWTGGGLNTSSNPAVAFPTDTTIYTVFGTSVNGCFGHASITVTVLPEPIVEFTSTPQSGCVPLNVLFNETSTDTNIVGWHWMFGDGTTSNLENPTHTYSPAGSYTVSLTVTNSENCKSTLVKNDFITVHPQPIGEFSFVPEVGKVYQPTITFHSSSETQHWLWDFGGGQTSTSAPPVSHTFPAVEGLYEVILTVFNDFGCSDTVKKEVLIIDDVLEFPNIITPNGDGINDVLEIINADKYPNNSLQVFNRWGKKVFEQVNYQNNWNGEGLIDGTYYYIFRYLDKAHRSSLKIMRN